MIDILNLEWNSSGRDIDIVEPVLSYMEIFHGRTVRRVGMADFELKIIEHRPKVLLLSNSVGAYENFHAAKMASKLGVKVVTLISEGDFAEHPEGVKEFYWGWNEDHLSYDDLHLEWSQRNFDLITTYIPESQKCNIKVSGATGFDRYKLMSFSSRADLLNKINISGYTKIVGIAGWGFDLFLGNYELKDKKKETLGEEEFNLHAQSKEPLRLIYKELIQNNPDILFILKQHPGVIDETFTEFFELDHYPNAVIVKSREPNIADVINCVDLWLAYESTTCLEAWLLNKQTMLVNPMGDNFRRSRISKGSPIVRTANDLQYAVDQSFATGILPGFPEKEQERNAVISEIIGYADGQNHRRAAEFIEKLFDDVPNRRPRIDRYFIMKLSKALTRKGIYSSPMRYLFLKKYKRYLAFSDLFSIDQREKERCKYASSIKEFYEKFQPNDLDKSKSFKSNL